MEYCYKHIFTMNTVTFTFIARKANTFIIRMFKMTAVTLTTHAGSVGTIITRLEKITAYLPRRAVIALQPSLPHIIAAAFISEMHLFRCSSTSSPM